MLGFLSASHRLGQLLGLEVRATYSLYAFIALAVLAESGRLTLGLTGLLVMAAWITFIGFVFLHELGHCLAAFKEGVGVSRISLTPLGGLAELSDPIPGPAAEIVIALAGPFVSLLCAALAWIPLGLLGRSANLFGNGWEAACGVIFTMNLGLALFNLLPIFPLDGGRVALAAACLVWGPERGLAAAGRLAKVGLALLVAAALLALLGGNLVTGLMLGAITVMLSQIGGRELSARNWAQGYLGRGMFAPAGESWPSASEPQPTPASGLSGWLTRRRQRQEERRRAQREEMSREVDRILAKVNADGIGSLTATEREMLNQASRMYREK